HRLARGRRWTGIHHRALFHAYVHGRDWNDAVGFVDARSRPASASKRPPPPRQYSPLITKNDPRIVPASLDFCLANLKRVASSAGTSIPADSLNPTARFFASSTVYITLMERPLS